MPSLFSRAAVLAVAIVAIAGCGRPDAAQFDGRRAFDLLNKQCSIGPRYAGTPGQTKMVELIKTELAGRADRLVTHTVKHRVPAGDREFTNIYAVFNPKASRFVLLCAHWDSRPTADEEVDPAKRGRPIAGANDGASGVAVLLELARGFRQTQPRVGVVMAFFDGEDYGPGPADMFIGSEAFARDWKAQLARLGVKPRPDYGILLDMVGDKDLQIAKEKFSVQKAPDVVDKVWKAARSAGHGSVFVSETRYAISDDHVPLILAGIKCIDVIDFDYAHWHTLDDTPDKCSPASLQIVGDVVARVIYAEPTTK